VAGARDGGRVARKCVVARAGSTPARATAPAPAVDVERWGGWSARTIHFMLTVLETAARVGRSPDTVRRWIREGRLPAQRRDGRQLVEDRDVRAMEDEIHPMAALPEEWLVGDDGSPAPNWVAALHRSRSGR